MRLILIRTVISIKPELPGTHLVKTKDCYGLINIFLGLFGNSYRIHLDNMRPTKTYLDNTRIRSLGGLIFNKTGTVIDLIQI